MGEPKPSYMSVSREFLPEVIGFLDNCGAFLRGVTMEAVTYRIEFQHPNFDGCETEMIFSRNTERGSLSISIENRGPLAKDEERHG